MKAKALVLAALLLVAASPAAMAQDVNVPGNIGNADDGVLVDPQDLVGVTGVSPGWVPAPADLLRANCTATADAPTLVTQNGIVLIRGTAHWDCNMALPGSTIEACLDLVFPSVSCNEKFRASPTSHLAVKVDFPCVPGLWFTMAAGENLFDTNPRDNVDHSDYGLLVTPDQCEYLNKH